MCDYIAEDGTTYYQFEAEDMFDDYLDEAGTVNIAGMEFYPSALLSNAEPATYSVAFADWRDAYGLDEYRPGHEWEGKDEDEDEDEDED